MYTIVIEIHGIVQLERLQPALVQDVTRQCIAAVEIQGGTYVAANTGLKLFRFQKARPEDHNGVVECLEQLIGILRARENELAGWNIYLDYLQCSDDELVSFVKDRTALISVDDCAWIGDDAASLIGHYLQLEDVEFGNRTFHRVVRSESPVALPGGSVEQLAESSLATEAILDLFDPNELDSGIILVYGEDRLAARVNASRSLGLLAGDAQSVGWLEMEPEADETGYGPLLSALTELHLHETRFWLTGAEQAVWDERVAMLQYLMHPIGNLCLPDRLSVDLICAFEHYISAYVRRAVASLAPPVILCHELDLWPPVAVEVFATLLNRFEETADQRAPLVLATAGSGAVPGPLRSSIRAKLRLPRIDSARIREAADAIGASENRPMNWERLHRSTGNRSDLVLHYLTHANHWELLSESKIHKVTPTDITWQVVKSLDRDVQEALLGICHIGRLLKADDLLELLTDLGIDRVRVTSIVTRLRSLGIVQSSGHIICRYNELQRLLEAELAESAVTVHRRIVDGCGRLLADGRLIVTEKTLQLFNHVDNGSQVPELYHQLVSRLLDERALNQAHRLLYDAVPSNGFSEATRKCMQAVLYTNRLRLAHLQANVQEAERVRGAAERLDGSEQCGFVVADLTLERARLSARIEAAREALTLIKRAIITYQELENTTGLARGNLDFGLVLLAQEEVLEAREYFQLAKKMALASGNLFEQIRADLLQLISTFIDGNYSRVLSHADELSLRTSKAAMREVQLFAHFAAARSLFELGRYEEAAAGFDSGRTRARFYGWKPAGDLFRRWLARSLIYDNRIRRAIEMLRDEPEGKESCFFAGEAWLLFGEHGKALAAFNRALELPQGPRSSIEAIPWETGYAGLEDRAVGVFGGTKVIDHQLLALRGYVLAESGHLEEGVQEMHKLTREVRLSEIDPFNRLYYYIYSLILPESGDLNIEDRNTVLGRAVRYIQDRTSRMDEYSHKTDFLRRNYWNNRLMSHAQSSNLV